MSNVSKPKFSEKIWNKIEGTIQTQTEGFSRRDYQEREQKLLEVVKEGVKHVQ